MKTKKKLVKYLAIAFLSTVTLTACSGGSGSSGSTSTQPPITDPETSTWEFTVDLFDFAKSIYGGIAPISPYLWNYMTTGSLEKPLTPNQLWNRKALEKIEGGINLLINNQNEEFTILNNIYEQQLQDNVYYQSQAFIDYTSNMDSLNHNIGEWIYSTVKTATGSESAAFSAKEAFNGGSSKNTLSSDTMKILMKDPKGLQNVMQLNTIGNVTFDEAIAQLACDSNVSYSWNAKNNDIRHPAPVLAPTSTCAFAGLLNALNGQFAESLGKVTVSWAASEFNTLTMTTPGSTQIYGTQGSNTFAQLQRYYYTIDALHLQTIKTLGRAYQADQARVYFFTHLANAANYVSLPTAVAALDSGSYAAAESDLKLSYETRVMFVESMVQQAKEQALQAALGSVASSGMSTCGVNVNQIESSQTIFESNVPYWDGNTLTVTCNSKRYESTITTTTPLSTMCMTLSPNISNPSASYNLVVSDGYIKCGQGQYLYTPVLNHYTSNSTQFEYDKTPPLGNYGGAYYLANAYQYSNGTLDVYWAWNGGGSQQPQWIYPYVFKNNGFSYSANSGEYTGTYTFGPLGNLSNGINGWVIGVGSNNDFEGSSGGGVIVDDGVHAYMVTGTGINYNASAFVIECIPNDPNCTAGFFANNNKGTGTFPNNLSDYQGLVFSNGDVVVSTQNGGTNIMGSHGDYYIQTFYNGTPAPSTSFSPPNFNYHFPKLVIGPNKL